MKHPEKMKFAKKLWVMEFFQYFSRVQHPKIYKDHLLVLKKFFGRRPVLFYRIDLNSGVRWVFEGLKHLDF